MGVIFFLSHQSFAPSEETSWIIQLMEGLRPLPPDKVAHFGLYFILGLLGFWRLGSKPWLLWLFCLAYGVSDEFHQSFVPGRHPDLLDLLADGLGAMSAILLLKWRSRSLRVKSDNTHSKELSLNE